MKKKLLLICQHFHPEMVSTGLLMTELAASLNKNHDDVEIEVLCSYPSKNSFTHEEIVPTYQNVNIIRKRSNGKEHRNVSSRILFTLSFFIRVFSYLLFHHKKYAGFIITTAPPFLGFAAVIIKRLFAKPYFLIVYDVYPDLAVKMGMIKEKSFMSRIWNFISITMLKEANGISVIGSDMQSVIEAKAKGLAPKVFLIRNWSDADYIKPLENGVNVFLKQHPELAHKHLFVYSGNMGRTHNMEDIIALAKAFETENKCMFLLIGGGAKFNKVHQETKHMKNVRVLPYQPYELLPYVLGASTFCFVCLEKKYTGCSVPSKTYAIMAAGKPLIAFVDRQSEIGLTIEEAACGFIVSGNDAGDDLKKMILRSIENEEHKHMGNRSREAFLCNYTLKTATTKYYYALKEAFKDPGFHAPE